MLYKQPHGEEWHHPQVLAKQTEAQSLSSSKSQSSSPSHPVMHLAGSLKAHVGDEKDCEVSRQP